MVSKVKEIKKQKQQTVTQKKQSQVSYAKAGAGIGEHTNGKIGISILIKELVDRKKKIKHLNQELIRKKGILNKNFGDILNN